MSSAAERIPSFEELYHAIEALPPGLTGEILEPGVIRTMGRPGGSHRLAARGIAKSLSGEDQWEGGRGWWFEQEAELHLLGNRLAVPDLAGWRIGPEQSMPPAFALSNPMTERPDWCCEVLSDSTRSTDRQIKVPLYAGAGVEWIWLVDPDARALEVFRAQAGSAELIERIEGAVERVIPSFSSPVSTER